MRRAAIVVFTLLAVPIGVFVWSDSHKVPLDLTAAAAHDQALLRAAGVRGARCVVAHSTDGTRSFVGCGWTAYPDEMASDIRRARGVPLIGLGHP